MVRSAASDSENRSSRSSLCRWMVCPVEAVEAADEPEVLLARQQLVDGGGLAGQAHRPAHRLGLADHVVPRHPRGAAGGGGQRRHHPHRRGLAGPVGTEQPQHRATRHVEADPVDGDGLPEVLDELFGLDGRPAGLPAAHSAAPRSGGHVSPSRALDSLSSCGDDASPVHRQGHLDCVPAPRPRLTGWPSDSHRSGWCWSESSRSSSVRRSRSRCSGRSRRRGSSGCAW